MNHRPDHSDAIIGQLLATTAADAAPPDRAALAALRDRSTQAFLEAGRETALTHEQKSNMFLTRAFIALIATAAAVFGGLWIHEQRTIGPPPVASLTLGEALDNVAAARSYRGRLLRDGSAFEILGRGREALRIETAPARYTIARGQTLWQVDEAENVARPSASQYYSPAAGGIDPLHLVDIHSPAVRDARPTEKRTQGGREFYIYHAAYRGEQAFEVEAWVDAATGKPTTVRGTLQEPGRAVDLGTLQFVAFDEPIAESQLQVAATLTEDGRIGTVVESQGIVSLRPKTAARWTPVCGRPILRPGDWLRTDFQGPNAVTVRLAPQTQLVLGPGSLVELVKPDQIVLHSGFVEITPAAKGDAFSGVVKLAGPAGATMDVGGVVLVRADARGLTKLAKEPAWLAGYKGTAVRESLGSLVAEIDGRRVPLTVGYHKVSVEIRDQIARTTIEESFVNHTASVLEGQFHFPLPADASISGFGMWIGDKLVEADIVEKQRAREIYEEILREKRDPGLLEWTGGNVFKARVYPIPAKSEKRIKIVFTQVLPRQGNTYRYSYALQSDLLRQNPLRQLELEVTVASTQPLASVASPTHQTRSQLTPHAARVEYSAQNYTPTRDFEVIVETEGQTPDITFIPHHRGDDGYFLLQLQPPAQGAWQRDVLPDGEPLSLLVLADTSASMDAAARLAQAEVLASILSSLGPKDAFDLAACDVECTWAFAEVQRAEEKSVSAARKFLAQRRSLGWTNLDRAFESAAKKAQPGTHVVYLGDGIVTYGDMDGSAFAQRLVQRLGDKGATIHAVAVSNSYDAPVLRGMASVGGGSVRHLSGEVGPQETAKNLLAEIARPALRNIQLEFQGLQTARVYPRVLPNVPAGTQQIVLGRYLPQAQEQKGEVIATGTLNGKRVTYRTAITVPGTQNSVPDTRHVNADANSQIRDPKSDSDASFIPRLWARMHLDELLAQGASQEIQDEIIALSEEFHIITPYTSLLVLESDADRERFKVKKRFLMRDGERFFADARDQAQYQLVQDQRRRAGLWRAGLRRSVLASLAGLGREQQEIDEVRMLEQLSVTSAVPVVLLSDSRSGEFSSFGGVGVANEFTILRGFGGMGGMLGDYQKARLHKSLYDHLVFDPQGAASQYLHDFGVPTSGDDVSLDFARPVGEPREVMAKLKANKAEAFAGGWLQAVDENVGIRFNTELDMDLDGSVPLLYDAEGWAEAVKAVTYAGRRGAYGYGFGGEMEGKKLSLVSSRLSPNAPGYPMGYTARMQELPPLLPEHLPPAPAAQPPAKERKSIWPERAQQISRGLRSSLDLAKLSGALQVAEESRNFENQGRRLVTLSHSLGLHAATAWLTREESRGTDEGGTGPRIEWANGQERGVLNVPYGLALVRKSAPTDLPQVYEASDYWQSNLEWNYRDRLVEVQPQEEGRVLLVLREPLRPDHHVRILIDENRHVALSIEFFTYSRKEGSIRASDFTEVAGVWLPQKIETLDQAGHATHVVTRKYTLISADNLAEMTAEQLAPRASALSLAWPLPKLETAKERIRAGRGSVEDRLVVLAELAAQQKWEEATAELTRIEEQARGTAFTAWIRTWLLAASRRNEELRMHLLTRAKALANEAKPGEWVLVQRIWSDSDEAFSPAERLELLEALKPIYLRQPEPATGRRIWTERRRAELSRAGRVREELALLKQLVQDCPDAVENHRTLAERLVAQGDAAEGYAVLRSAIDGPGKEWPAEDKLAVYRTWNELLEGQGRYDDIVTLAGEWLKLAPEESDPYERFLAALVYMRREGEADQHIAAWLAEGLAEPPLEKAAVARCQAAIETVLGDNSYLRNGDFDPKWLPPLFSLIEAHLDRDDEQTIAYRADGDWEVQRTEGYRLLAQQLFARLKKQAAELPAGRLARLVEWCMSHSDGTLDADWRTIAAAVRPRWEAATHPSIRDSLAETLLRVLSQISFEEKLAFVRERLANSTDDERDAQAMALFNALLEADWSPEIEAESLALIDKLASQAQADARLQSQVAALYRWTDRMEEARNAKLESEIERPDKLTSTQLDERRKGNRAQVRTNLAARLKAAAAKRQDGLKKWLLIEQLTLQARLERNQPQVVESLWELLGLAPEAAKIAAEHAAPSIGEQLDAAFRSRAITMLVRLSIRTDAPPAEAERIGQHLDRAIAADADGRAWGIDARLARYVHLVALDRPQELIEKLTAWSQGTDRPQLWKRTLAWLKAELGQLDEAAALAEALRAEDALLAEDYRALAGWYQALQRDEQARAASLAAWKQMDEWRLRDLVSMHLRLWQNSDGPHPTAIDPQVLEVIETLLQKAGEPRQHVYLVRNLYEASRDFRLLAGLADAVIGQTSGNIYPFLGELARTLDEIDREATVDELVAHIAKVRERAATPVDRRALDLLEMLAAKRAAQLQNQPGPHAERAIAALQRSLVHQWTTGEELAMAGMLAGLGQIPEPKLSAARAAALRQLHNQVAGNPDERLQIAHALAQSLEHDNRRQEALDALEPALAEHVDASGRQYVWLAMESVRLAANLHADEGRYVRGQQLVREAEARAANGKVAREMVLVRFGLDVRALETRSSSTLGSGLALFQEAQKQLIAAALAAQDHEFRRRLVETTYRLYRAAAQAKLAEAGPAAVAFTKDHLPVLLDRQIDSHQELVNDAARMLRDVASPREALAFYITRLEVEPSWLARSGQPGWQRFAYEMGDLFDHETVRQQLGDLTPRLLAIVLTELRRDLRRQDYNQRSFYHQGYGHFWQEKTADFARAAEEVLREQRDSLRAVTYIADYLYSGLGRYDRAIAVLLDAHRRGLLDQDARSKLIVWLQVQQRFGESIALLEPLVKNQPGTLQYRLQLMHAYFRTSQPEALRALLAATDKYFHEEGRWNEDVAGELAASCLENQLLEPAVEYFKEAIARRQELLGGRLVRDQKLAQHFVNRAYAYAGLKNTRAAVDDAASALVVWGAAGDGIYRRNIRGDWLPGGSIHPIDVLKEVLTESPNLDAYVVELDREVAATQQDRPVVRKALGEVYAERKAWDKAIAQLKQAVELAPTDAAIHAKLVECYRQTGDKAAELNQLFASVELARRDIDLWVQLAALLEQQQQPDEAERARTSLVEMLPQETEGHQKLAQIREEQGRLDDAIGEWRHVARLRKLEPAGLLGLAAVQIKQKDRPAAEETLRQLERTDWPQRFSNQLQEQLPKLRESLRSL